MHREHIMVPGHPDWPEFVSKLSRAPVCFGTREHARAVLANMPGIDVEESLKEMASLGGTCDCHIELDVAATPARAG